VKERGKKINFITLEMKKSGGGGGWGRGGSRIAGGTGTV